MSERNVETAKNIFKKVSEDLKDIYLLLLLYRNMPAGGMYSPAELLMSKRLRSTLPCRNKQLKPKPVNSFEYNQFIKDKQDSDKKHYNKRKGVQTLYH